jgi:hypothetical protein
MMSHIKRELAQILTNSYEQEIDQNAPQDAQEKRAVAKFQQRQRSSEANKWEEHNPLQPFLRI